MRLLFIADKLEVTSGSAQKAVAVASEWERRGHTVWLATAREPWPKRVAEAAASMRELPPPRTLPRRVLGEVSFRALHPYLFVNARGRLGLDAVYCRGLPFSPGLRRLLALVPCFVEINGDVASEIRESLPRWFWVRARTLQLRRACGVVFVSRELQRACRPEPRRSIVLANSCLPKARGGLPSPRPERPTLVQIGYERHRWSGVEQMPGLAAALPDLDLVVIGAMVSGPPNLRCYPVLPQAEADRVMCGCTVGIGPAALYRAGLREASSLKSRNYLALGLPVIQAYEDTDLTEADGCILELPNREGTLLQNAERIREFAWRAYREPSLSERALALARGRLALESKERERLEFLASCLEQ